MLFAGCFCDQYASMASCPVKEPALMLILRFMLRTNRIVGTKPPQFQRGPQKPIDLSAGFDQSAEGAFGIGRSHVEKDAVSRIVQSVNTLAN